MVYLTLLIPVILGIGFLNFTRLTGARNLVDELWAEVHTYLGNRHDLIPAFVERAKEYTDQEPPVFAALGQARTRCMNIGDIKGKIEAEKALTLHLSQFLSLAGSMPALKQDHHFVECVELLKKTEKQVAQTVREYNTAVRSYNAQLDAGLTGMVAHLLCFRPETPFDVMLVTTS